MLFRSDFSTHPKAIIESAGAQYAGIQQTDRGDLHVFRDPLTGTSLAVYALDLTVDQVELRLSESRVAFGHAPREVRP